MCLDKRVAEKEGHEAKIVFFSSIHVGSFFGTSGPHSPTSFLCWVAERAPEGTEPLGDEFGVPEPSKATEEEWPSRPNDDDGDLRGLVRGSIRCSGAIQFGTGAQCGSVPPATQFGTRIGLSTGTAMEFGITLVVLGSAIA
jgi:hypothetical protein